MQPDFRPMLAAECEDANAVKYPVWVTPKFDGIRCVTTDQVGPPGFLSVPVTRSIKDIPNRHIFRVIGMLCPPGLDGELITYPHNDTNFEHMHPFSQVQSCVMSQQGEPRFLFHVFDYNVMYAHPGGYRYRWEALRDNKDLPAFVRKVLPKQVNNPEELGAAMEDYLAQGYEGLCFRTEQSPYKWGRSTWKQQWLVKYKDFKDAEATCIGVEELYSNRNAPTINMLGYQERSSHQANMVPMGTLGALVVQNHWGTFKVGTGFSEGERAVIWEDREQVVGKIVKFKYQPHGMKNVPRIPVFIAFRDPSDMDAKPQQLEQKGLL